MCQFCEVQLDKIILLCYNNSFLNYKIHFRNVKMNKLCIFIGMTVLSWLGWWLGAKIGIMTAFILSSIGAFAGIYLGWKINQNYF